MGNNYLLEKEDVVWVNMTYPNMNVNLRVSSIFPYKTRKSIFHGSEKTIIWDETKTSEKIQIYDGFVEILEGVPNFIPRNPTIPNIDYSQEPLRNSIKEFIDCIDLNKSAITDINQGLRIARILEKVDLSLRMKKIIEL